MIRPDAATPRPYATRTLVRSGLVLPLVGALVLAAAAPASAAISGVERGEVIAEARTLSLVADYGPSAPDNPPRLAITEPGGSSVVVASAEPDLLEVGQLTYPFNPECWVPSAPSTSCRTPKPASNGTWTVVQTGSTPDTLTFTLKIAPMTPRAVAATAASPREMRVSWRRGAEPDLTSYSVFEGDEPARDGLVPADVCDNTGVCSTVVTYPMEGTGEHRYTVRAFRSDGAGGVLVSAPSSEASGDLSVPPPSAAPSDPAAPGDPSAPPGDSASPGATGSPLPGATAGPSVGGTSSSNDPTANRRKAFSLGFNTFGPKLGIPKLPPLPAAPTPPTVAKLPDGTFEPTLGFEDQELSEEAEPGTDTGAAQRVSSTVGDVFDSEQLAKSTAGALILLLAGAHMRRWLSDSTLE